MKYKRQTTVPVQDVLALKTCIKLDFKSYTVS